MQRRILHTVLEVVILDAQGLASQDTGHVVPVNETAEVVVSARVYIFLYSEHPLDRTLLARAHQQEFLVVPVRDNGQPGVVQHYPHVRPLLSASRSLSLI